MGMAAAQSGAVHRTPQTCYTAIKAADPDAIVISAGLAPTGAGDPSSVVSDTDFLRGMYAAGAADYFDVLGTLTRRATKRRLISIPEIAATAQDENGL